MNKKMLENLEKKLGVATKIVEDLDLEELSIKETEIEHVEKTDEIFSNDLLKKDFLMVRQNLISLISKGQTLFDKTSELDLTELKASQIEALATLQKTISENLKMLIEIYRDIVEIENKRNNKNEVPQLVNTGTLNQVLFNGSTLDLLNALK